MRDHVYYICIKIYLIKLDTEIYTYVIKWIGTIVFFQNFDKNLYKRRFWKSKDYAKMD